MPMYTTHGYSRTHKVVGSVSKRRRMLQMIEELALVALVTCYGEFEDV